MKEKVKFRETKIINPNGIPLMSTDDEVFTGMAFTLLPERRSEAYIKRLVKEAGIKLWFPIIKCEWPNYESEKSYDFSGINMILDVDPDALIIPRFAMMPPPSWRKDNSEELAVAGNSLTKRIIDSYSIASDIWLDAAKGVLKKLIETLNNHQSAKNIIGLFTGIGSHTEGGGWSSWMEKECQDLSEPARKAFVKFLKNKYSNFNELKTLFQKEFWQDWDDVTVPSFEERMVSDVGAFHDPAHGGAYIREHNLYREYLHFNRLEEFGKTIKKASEGKLLYGCFHGYCGRSFSGGGNNLFDCLNSKFIDFLAAPPAYDDRAIGGSITHSMPIDSINAHGKIFINECDVRTSLAEPMQKKYGAPKSIAQSCENIKHFVGYCLAHKNYGWYLEPGVPTSNEKPEMWFDDPKIASTMLELDSKFNKYKVQSGKLNTEIAVIWDNKGGFDTSFTIQGDNASEHFSSPGSLQINEMLRMEINRIGAPVSFYLIEDLIDGIVPENIKFFIFVNTFGMTENSRLSIKDILLQRKATELWFYGSAYVDWSKNRLSFEAMHELLDMNFSIDENWGTMEIELNENGVQKFKNIKKELGIPYRFRRTGLGLHASFTPAKAANDYYSPFFIVKDDSVEALGHYKKRDGVAMAYKNSYGRNIYYSSSPFASFELLREIAKLAGVHIMLEDGDDVVYSNSDITVIHSSSSAEKSITLCGENSQKIYMSKGETEIIEK